MPALAATAKFLVAAGVGYVTTRVGWVFFGGLGAVVALLVLGAAAFAGWSRRERAAVGGLAAGALVTAAVLTL